MFVHNSTHPNPDLDPTPIPTQTHATAGMKKSLVQKTPEIYDRKNFE